MLYSLYLHVQRWAIGQQEIRMTVRRSRMYVVWFISTRTALGYWTAGNKVYMTLGYWTAGNKDCGEIAHVCCIVYIYTYSAGLLDSRK